MSMDYLRAKLRVGEARTKLADSAGIAMGPAAPGEWTSQPFVQKHVHGWFRDLLVLLMNIPQVAHVL